MVTVLTISILLASTLSGFAHPAKAQPGVQADNVNKDFSYSNFSSTSGLTLNGNAAQAGNVLRLTPANYYQDGSTWFNTKQNVVQGFTTTFQFQISAQGNGGADGFAFVIQNVATSALGGNGGGIGYDGLPNSLAVEFDTWPNAGDISDNEIAVHTNGVNPNSASESFALSPGPVTPGVSFASDGIVHTVKVVYGNNTMIIFLDSMIIPVLTAPVNLATTLNLSNDTAYVGFTAATGAAIENHDILSWSFGPSVLADINGDGIPDAVALSPEFQALGADPCRKTIPVQIDYMVAGNHTHRPFQAAIDKVVAAFDAAPVPVTSPCPYAGFPKKSSGIKLIVDVENAIPEQAALNFTGTAPETFDTIKARYFDPARAPYFHYSLWVHDLAPGSTVSGIGELGGANFIVSLGEWINQTGTVEEQAGTFMHELGHNLRLDHGGGDSVNFKPNYLSVENYAFQTVGITSLLSNGTITTRFDYSRTALPTLNESSLSEAAGINDGNDYTSWFCPNGQMRTGLGDSSLDWNCNGAIDGSPARVDLNNDTSLGTLAGFNDWARLNYTFTQTANFVRGDHSITPTGRELRREQAKPIETFWKAFSSQRLNVFFADSELNPLPLDSKGNPKVDVVLAKGVVRSTNPGQVLAWVNITNTAGGSVNSLQLKETLPVDWSVSPPWMSPSAGAIHVFFVLTNGKMLEITNRTSVSVTPVNPQRVSLSIANITATPAGTPLATGHSILVSVKLSYALIGGSQPATTYPRNYTDTATITSYSGASFTGASTSNTRSAFFVAHAKVLGDVDGDLSVDITDLILVWQHEFTANTQYDVDGDGAVDLNDLVLTWQLQFA